MQANALTNSSICKVVSQASFVNQLGADSLDTVELLMALEQAFGVEIPDEEAERLTTGEFPPGLKPRSYGLESSVTYDILMLVLIVHAATEYIKARYG